MTHLEGATLFKSRDTIVEELINEFQTIVPDLHTGADSVVRILCEVMATVIESVFLSVQIVNEDMFVNTANLGAMYRHGEEFGVFRKIGARAAGTVRFSGVGGIVVPIGSQVAYDPQTGGDLLYFDTTGQQTLPNPGIPTALTAVMSVSAGNPPIGSYEYVVTFVTAAGETEPGAESTPVVLSAARQITLSAIPVGGAGTTQRKIYRSFNGDSYHLVATIAGNVTTGATDNSVEPAVGAAPPVESTAESILIACQSEDSGIDYNVLTGAITVPVDVPDGITDVLNLSAFTGGTDSELPEDYRLRLIDAIRNPNTGSASDLQAWAEEVVGVETATVISNDNLGTPTNGHATVRISGPDGAVPGAAVIQAVYDALAAKDMANITLHVGTFTPVVTAVNVTITLEPNYILADVSPHVVTAITDYVNALGVGETFRVNGVIAEVMTLTGVADVAVTSPASNQATGSTSKRTAGTITVI